MASNLVIMKCEHAAMQINWYEDFWTVSLLLFLLLFFCRWQRLTFSDVRFSFSLFLSIFDHHTDGDANATKSTLLSLNQYQQNIHTNYFFIFYSKCLRIYCWARDKCRHVHERLASTVAHSFTWRHKIESGIASP